MRASALHWTLALCGAFPAAQAESPQADVAAETRALVQRLVLDRAAAIAAVQRIADEREERLFAELAVKDRRLRAESGSRAAAQTDLARVTAERQRLVDEIATRDRQFAAEIAEYRKQVASIANSPDPRKRAALERYAEGDRAGAFEALLAIQEAETKAVAAGWREIAALAQDRKDRSEMGTAQVISIYEKAQSLETAYLWGWIELRRLYQEAGRLADARSAAEEALERAEDARDRSVAETELGNVLVSSGDLVGARMRFEASLAIGERLAEANPTSAEAQRDLSVSLNKLGDVLVSSGDLVGARARFEASLAIDERLAEANPTSAEAQRDLSVSLNKLGDVLVSSGDLAGARARFEASLAIGERLAEANPTSAEAQRDLIVSHAKLGGLPGGEDHWSEALKIALDLQRRGLLPPRDAWMIDELRQRVAAAGGDGR